MSDTTDTLIPQSSPAIPSYKLPKKLIFAVAALLFIGLILGLTLGFLLPVGNENLCHPSKFGDFPNDPLERAKKVLTVCPLVDTHNDLPWTLRGDFKDRVWDADLNTNLPGFHTSIPLLKEGHVGGQIWSVYVGCGYMDKDAVRTTQEQIDVVYQLQQKYPDFFHVAQTADETESLFRAGKFPSLMGMEGGHQIDNSLASLRAFRRQGVRYMTLTHNCNLEWAESCCPTNNINVTGLTDFGKAVVREMNRIGMLVDISHASVQTMRDALDTSVSPLIFSHSNAYALCPTARNVPDEILKRVPENGGAVCITFVPGFTDCSDPPKPTIEMVADHIEHIAKTASYDSVCLGGDFDGIPTTIPGLGNVSTYPALIEELYKRAWTDENIIKLVGGNIIRVLRAAEKVSDSLNTTIPGQDVMNNLTVSTGCRTRY